MSVPERAWLELLADVPHRITFEMADAIGGRLAPDRIDLGTGNRALVPQGRLDPTYRITYPRGLDGRG